MWWPSGLALHTIVLFSQIHCYMKGWKATKHLNGYLFGDSGYPCKSYLMTPYAHPTNAKQEAYNKAHCKTRVAIEQTFGRRKRRFHLLHSKCRMKPEKVCTLIDACAVLHNISIILNDSIGDDPIDDDQPELVPYYGPNPGRLIREHICITFF